MEGDGGLEPSITAYRFDVYINPFNMYKTYLTFSLHYLRRIAIKYAGSGFGGLYI